QWSGIPRSNLGRDAGGFFIQRLDSYYRWGRRMVKKSYDWVMGEILDDHSRREHKIIREYFADYLRVRCQLPQQSKFRLAVVDGFAGGGRYSCGTPGSPIIFIEELQRAAKELNVARAAQGMAPIEIECLLILNDATRETIELLKTHVPPLQAN